MKLSDLLVGSGGILVVVLMLIQISPLKLDPWSWLARKLGEALNREVLARVEDLKAQVGKLRTDLERVEEHTKEQAAIDARTRILRFGDEVLQCKEHTKDHFDQILLDIDVYNSYCESHPDFPNHVTMLTSKRIEEVYLRKLTENDFL